MISVESTKATYSHMIWRLAISHPSLWSMRAIIVMPVAVSSSTHGMMDWLAYGWKRAVSPQNTRNSAAAAHNMMAYCTGNAPVVRWNIWMNASALIATASRSSAIWRKRVAIIAILPWWRRRLPQCRTRTCWYCRKWTSWMSLTSCWMWTSWPARSPAAS